MDVVADFVVAVDASEGEGDASDAVENPEAVVRGVIVDDHMAAYLCGVEGKPPYFYEAYGFEGYDVEYVDVEGHGSTVGEEASGDAVGVGQPEGYAVKYDESSQACEG